MRQVDETQRSLARQSERSEATECFRLLWLLPSLRLRRLLGLWLLR